MKETLSIRPWVLADYPTLSNYWEMYGWVPVDQAALPSTGWVVSDDTGLILCASFLYLTNSAVAWPEWTIGNPLISKEKRSQALDLLMDYTIEEAKKRNYKVLMTFTPHGKLIERYQKHGYSLGDQGVVSLVRRV